MGHTPLLLHVILHVTGRDFACEDSELYVIELYNKTTVHGCSSQELLFVLLFKYVAILVMIMKFNITSYLKN